MSDLILSGDSKFVLPVVATEANPTEASLLAVRNFISTNEAAAKAFGSSSDDLVAMISKELDVSSDNAREAVQYLSDEKAQFGDSPCIVSSTTGKVLYVVRPEDMWVPPEVPRDDGSMAQPTAKVRPDIVATLTRWVYEAELDEKNYTHFVNKLMAMGPVLPQDARLEVLTRTGRTGIAKELSETPIQSALQLLRGTPALFRDQLTWASEERDSWRQEASQNFVAMSVSDTLTHNWRFSIKNEGYSLIAVAFLKTIAVNIPATDTISVKDVVSCVDYSDTSLVITPPELLDALTGVSCPKFVVSGAPLIPISGNVGKVVYDPRKQIGTSEIFGTWSLYMRVGYEFTPDPALRVFRVDGLTYMGEVV